MNKQEIKSKIEEILEIPDTSLDTPIREFLLDSLEILEAVIRIEDSLEINIVLDFKLQTYNDFVELVYNSYLTKG